MKKNKTTDIRIKKMVKNNFRAIPENEWFVKKTINRLPPENTRILSIPEIIAFLLVFSVAMTVTVVELHSFMSATDSSPAFNLTLLSTSLFVMAVSTIYMAVSVIQKCK